MIHDKKQQFISFIETGLNEQQKAVVTTRNGVLLVRAGAGSGKTRVITARMNNLMLCEDVSPASIVALTFTNKAAREMKERMLKFLGHGAALPNVSTFHSYCLRMLKRYNQSISVPDFSMLDQDDQQKMMRSLLARAQVHKRITPDSILGQISRAKNDAVNGFVSPEWFADPLVKDLYQAYEHEKRLARCYDFDDLLLEFLKLLRQPTFKQAYQQQVRHVLVDEYQDTNLVQHALLKEMTCDQRGTFVLDSLCVVGDEDQSIYSWRGATVTNILHFGKDFPGSSSHTIDQNYRSAQAILDVANAVIKQNTQRYEKKLWSNHKVNDAVRLLTCMSGFHEGEAIAAVASCMQAKNALNSMAILYRSHYLSRAIEEALIRHSIPYKIIGGVQFYERQEIKDLLAYLKLVSNPYDRVSCMRIINVPTRGLGDKFQEQFMQIWHDNPTFTFLDVARQCLHSNIVTGIKAMQLMTFMKIFEGLQPSDRPSTVLHAIQTRTKFIEHLQNAYEDEEATARVENVKELTNAVQGLEDKQTISTVSEFLEEVALLQDHLHNASDDNAYVSLMTLHAAKGLEFDTVVLTGLEDGVLPSSRSLLQPEALEEERRLAYVGITRARQHLLVTHAQTRYLFGSMSDQRPSRFIKEMCKAPLNHHDAQQWTFQILKQYAHDWLHGRYQASVAQTVEKKTKVAFADDPFEDSINPAKASEWKRNDRVVHKTFGAGFVQSIEQRADGHVLTVRFAAGVKKVDSKFLKRS